MQITGRVMRIEHRDGDFVPKDSADGKAIAYDFHVLHVWDGHAMREVRLPKEVSPAALPFDEGDEVTLDISVPKGVRIFYVQPTLASV